MATDVRSGGNGFLYFVVGALVVIVGVLAYVMYSGNTASQNSANSALERSADAVGDAANAVEKKAKTLPNTPLPEPNMQQPAPQPVQP